MKHQSRSNRGVTIVEACIYAVIFAIFMGIATGAFFWMRKSLDATQKIGNLQDLRLASIYVNNELSYGNRILFPPVSNDKYHQVLFKNDRNELLVFFLDKDMRLNLLNYEKYKSNDPRGLIIIANNAIEFTVERPDAHLIKYFVRIRDEDNKENVIANAVKMRNTETNEPW
ncbi:MAG: hypothetical protein CVV42_07590 [Candidatus Riflebacteria bacterium HGW-Riflebacteria-2]|nr:MAG: hypothetical protein CVV42_07590 [Candidatus Riflebacteria bacterium HGW-Riflebacteria-2]